MRISLLLVVLFTLVVCDRPPWCQGHEDETDCANFIVSQLTLAEKIKQLGNDAPAVDRLKLPKWDWWGEALHGLDRQGYATAFPQSIGLGATWDPALLHELGDQVSTEDRLKREKWEFLKGYPFKGLSVWAPNVNIVRDPRWGRGQETYGEDPFLTGSLAVGYITGIQGPDAPTKLKSIATPKHFAVHSGPEMGRHAFNVNPSPYDFEDTYMPAFRSAVVDGQAGSVMCSYNAVNGVPACANGDLLSKRLREDWKFWGYVVSDCDAVYDEWRWHKYTKELSEASALSIKAGTDLDCGNSYDKLDDAIKAGQVNETVLDVALRRLFVVRLRTNEPNVTGNKRGDPAPDNRDLALEASHKAIVLIKNDGLLPLKSGVKKIAVVGPTADILEDLEGNYHATAYKPVSALDALYKHFGADQVTYAQGSGLDEGFPLAIPRSALRTADGQPGLRGEFYSNKNLDGNPALVRVDNVLDFDIDFTPLFDTPNPWDYSVRWTGQIVPPGPGTYYIGIFNDGDNPVKMWLNDQVLFDSKDQRMEKEVVFQSTAPQKVQIEYHHYGGMYFRLQWRPPANVQLKEALVAANNADVVVAFVGLSPDLESEETGRNETGFISGDRSTIQLPAVQEKLLQTLGSTGKPLVVVLNAGSALAVNWAAEHANAILSAWYSGEIGGQAITDTLLGTNNPGGKLPLTYYASDNDLPEFTNYEMEGRTYRYFRGKPLFPFGHGLSYTSFEYSDAKLSASQVNAGDNLKLTVSLKNTGKVDGDEVIQVYSRPSAGATPKKLNHALVSFSRVSLKAGETKTFTLEINARQLSLVDANGDRAVREGSYTLFVGGGQPDFFKGTLSLNLNINGKKDLPK